jgi:hypothetical protein
MKDIFQKDLLCRHFGSQNFYIQPEVPIFHKGGIHEQKKLITDIDVLALRPGLDLRWELVLGDCKTLKGQSPANRVLWLRGLMHYFSASAGLIILQRKQPIEQDHKLFAASLGIALVGEDEFEKYDRAIIYPEGSVKYPLSMSSITELRAISTRYIVLKEFCEFIYGFAWNETSRLELLRKVIGEAQTIAQELDPAKTEHLALVLDSVSVFAVGLAECVGIIFNQYLQPETQSQLDEALKVVIWGGRSHYEFVAKLRHDLMVAKGMQPGPEGTLALPNWESFLQLVRSMLEYPRIAFSVPQLIRQAAVDIYYNRDILSDTNYDDLLLIKFAMLTSNYFCRAAKFPAQAREMLETKFIKRQSELVHSSENKVELQGELKLKNNTGRCEP